MSYYKETLKFLFLPIIALLIGVFLIGLGIYEKVTSPTKGFEAATGYLCGSTLYEDEHYDAIKQESSAATYKLTYCFTVDSEKYFVTSDYSTAFVPAEGTPCEILYNPENPDEAVIGGPNKNSTQLMFIGFFFALGSLPFFIGRVGTIIPKKQSKAETSKSSKSSKKRKTKSDNSELQFNSLGIIMSVIVMLFGYGACCMMSNSFSIKGIISYYITSFTLPMIIPILLIAAGLYTVINIIYKYFKNSNKR